VNLQGFGNFPLPPLPLGVASLPPQCQTNLITTFSEGYVSRLDAVTGNVLSTVLVDGSNAGAAGVAFARGSSVWLAGPTSQADTPITPGAVTPEKLEPGPFAGAYLAQANFAASQGQPTLAPQISCIADGANEARTPVVAPNQILTLFGTGLGPAAGIAASNSSTTSLGGVSVTFDGVKAPLLYVSSSQINVAVPSSVLVENEMGPVSFTVMQLSVNGVAASPRQLGATASAPSLFADLSGTVQSCTMGDETYFGTLGAFALNVDGTVNSCSHPAKAGTVISLFVNGLGVNGITSPWMPSQIPVAVTLGEWSAEVVNVSAPSPFAWQVDVLIPADIEQRDMSAVTVTMDLNLPGGVVPVGPLAVQATSPSYTVAGVPFPVTVWVSP
jgi:uncharacterized protein (TIGR03437 family)